MPDVVSLGILVADIFARPIGASPAGGELALVDHYLLSVGGCAANTAAALGRLGNGSAVVGKVGPDMFGDFVLRDLERLGVDAAFVVRSKQFATSCTFIVNVRGEDRRYFHCFGANADFSLADVNRAAWEGARVLHVGGYLAMPAFRPELLRQLFQEAKQRGLITTLDVAIPAGAAVSLAEVREVLPWTDVFLPNHDEARALTGSHDPREQAEILSRLNPNCTIVITLGKHGVLARRGEEVLQAGTFKIDSVDESGSGDAFAAGFVVGLLRNWTLEESVRFASAVGASCTTALGCHAGVFTFQDAAAFVAGHQLEMVGS
jgi:sugar/nucleoside kinase (ribokinase family)